ncbi:MAG: carboxypeptidase-like regulatory domain-containing protein [candidate division Zixibacteria bacterium]|nr:carboxypeptidase-like regulatory domain-containing protein [candidate division Zixibacteria bacterium]
MRVAVLISMVLALIVGCDNKGTDTSGAISGYVYEAGTSEPIAAVEVTCGGVSFVTGIDGEYEIFGIATDSQTITATKGGYNSYSATVNVETSTTHNIYLTLSTPSSTTNQIRIECPVNVPVPIQDTTIAIDVYITSDVNIGGFSLGFHYDSEDVEIIDATPGPALPPDPLLLTTFIPADNLALIGFVDFSGVTPITPQNDTKLFSLIMRIPAGISSQWIDIDSSFVPPVSQFMLAPQGGGTIYPSYHDCGSADIHVGN